jgi:hypothetical protein
VELVILIAVTAGVIGVVGRLPETRRIKRDLARARIEQIDELADGKAVVVRGTVTLAEPDAELVAPITRRRCVYSLVTFDELGIGGDYVELGRVEQAVPFLLVSETGTARVVPDQPRVAIPSHVRLYAMRDLDEDAMTDQALLLARMVCRRPNYPTSSSLRITEYALAPGTLVTVKGYCTREPDPTSPEDVTGYREPPRTRPVISGTRRVPLVIG